MVCHLLPFAKVGQNVLSGRGLARRPLSARRVHIKMTSHVAQCIHNTSYCAARELCRLQIWTKRYREHFTVLVIWTLVYREHVPRTFCQGFVPRTYMNGLKMSHFPCMFYSINSCLKWYNSIYTHRTNMKLFILSHTLVLIKKIKGNKETSYIFVIKAQISIVKKGIVIVRLPRYIWSRNGFILHFS